MTAKAKVEVVKAILVKISVVYVKKRRDRSVRKFEWSGLDATNVIYGFMLNVKGQLLKIKNTQNIIVTLVKKY